MISPISRLCEVYLPARAGSGFDPTSGLLTGESHIPLAATPRIPQRRADLGVASYAVDFGLRLTVKRVAAYRVSSPLLRRG